MSNEDQKAARRIATYLATKFLVEADANGVRITFGEGFDGETTYHQAMYLSMADAVELNVVLGKQIRAARPEKSKED